MRITFLILLIVVSFTTEAATNKSYRVAEKSLRDFQKLLDGKQAANFGFQSPSEVVAMKLEAPLPHYQLTLYTLRAWKSESDVASVLDKTPSTLLFPITANQNIRSSIQVQKKSGLFTRWEATAYGGGKLTQLYIQARQASMATTGLPASSYVAVSIPELQAYFLGYRLSNQWMVLSVVNAPELGITKGVPTPALKILQTLGAMTLPPRNGAE